MPINLLVPCTGNSAGSKSWNEFGTPDAPHFDIIFTVCSSAANETCPVWPGHQTTAHWTLRAPAHVEPLKSMSALAAGRIHEEI